MVFLCMAGSDISGHNRLRNHTRYMAEEKRKKFPRGWTKAFSLAAQVSAQPIVYLVSLANQQPAHF